MSMTSKWSTAAFCVVIILAICGISHAQTDNVVIRWNQDLLQALQDTRAVPTVAARALAIVHSSMYDAWTLYDERAEPTTVTGRFQRRTNVGGNDKAISISFAAYRSLMDLFPTEAALFDNEMESLGFDARNISQDPTTPEGLGNIMASLVLSERHHDGSNQLGDLHPGAYSDYTNYVPVNTPDSIVNQDRWQPLRLDSGKGHFHVQHYIAPYWGRVTAFALTSDSALRSIGAPAGYNSDRQGYIAQADEIIDLTAGLTDRTKMIAEYWALAYGTVTPPGRWFEFAQDVSHRDRHTLDDDVKLFFVLGNTMLDASIACWDTKREFDAERPITAIHFLYKGQRIRSWAGPFKGTQWIDGADWQPYQDPTQVTPAFPEFTSGHSTFSSAAAEILKRWTGSDLFGESYMARPGTSMIEPGETPHDVVYLHWNTFTDAANEAGMSRRYGGIHYKQADLEGRKMGRLVAEQAWTRAQQLWGPPD